MTSKKKGSACVGAVIGKLLKSGHVVLLPLGDNERYDLVTEDNGNFQRIQCKLGKLIAGAVRFRTCSTNLEKGKWKQVGYKGQIEKFGVYCPDLDSVYLIPVEDVPDREACLRVEPSGNRQEKGIREASQYLV